MTSKRNPNNYTEPEEQTNDQKLAWTRKSPDDRNTDHKETFSDELGKLNGGEKYKEAFDNDKNLMDFSKKERLEHLQAQSEVFQKMDDNKDFADWGEKNEAAKEITRNSFRHVYNDFEKLEAKNAEGISDDMKQAFKDAGITDYRYNAKTDQIEFNFKDDEQLRKIQEKLGMPITVTSRGKGMEDYQGKSDTEPDESVEDAQKRREIDRLMNKYKQELIFQTDSEKAATKMNEYLERAEQYLHKTPEALEQENDLTGIIQASGPKKQNEHQDEEDLTGHIPASDPKERNEYREKLEEQITDRQQAAWDNAREAIDQISEKYPEEAESLRVAADALEAAHAERLEHLLNEADSHPMQDSRAIDEALTNMEKNAKEFITGAQEGRGITFTDIRTQEMYLEFTESSETSLEGLQAINDKSKEIIELAEEYKLGNYSDPNSDPDRNYHAIKTLQQELEQYLQYINQTPEDDQCYEKLMQDTSNLARALQHLMRPEAEVAESEQPVAV